MVVVVHSQFIIEQRGLGYKVSSCFACLLERMSGNQVALIERDHNSTEFAILYSD